MEIDNQSETLKQMQAMQNREARTELPAGAGLESATKPAAEEAPAPVNSGQEDAEAAVEETSYIEVDGQKFANEKAVFDYYKRRTTELEAQQMVEAARLEGMQEALSRYPQGQVSPQVAEQASQMEDFDEAEFYANPQAYLAKREAKLAEKLSRQFEAKQISSQREVETWNKFTSKYPELADLRDVVDLVADQNKEVVQAMARKDMDKALDYVAMKTKEKFQSFAESMKPHRELSSTKGGVSHGGGNPTVTNQQTSTKKDAPIDFISQLKKNRGR